MLIGVVDAMLKYNDHLLIFQLSKENLSKNLNKTKFLHIFKYFFSNCNCYYYFQIKLIKWCISEKLKVHFLISYNCAISQVSYKMKITIFYNIYIDVETN